MDRISVLRSIDKLGRIGAAGVLELLTVGRYDQSGDFTAGAGLGLRGACFVMAAIGRPVDVLCYRPEMESAIVVAD